LSDKERDACVSIGHAALATSARESRATVERVHLDFSGEGWHGQAKPRDSAELGRGAVRDLGNMAKARPWRVVH